MPKYETDLRQRARVFAVAAYHVSREIRQSYPALRNYADQMADAAGSIGANLAESEGLNSRREMAARYAIATKNETFVTDFGARPEARSPPARQSP